MSATFDNLSQFLLAKKFFFFLMCCSCVMRVLLSCVCIFLSSLPQFGPKEVLKEVGTKELITSRFQCFLLRLWQQQYKPNTDQRGFWSNDGIPVHHSCVVFVSHSDELTSAADHMLLNCMEPHRDGAVLQRGTPHNRSRRLPEPVADCDDLHLAVRRRNVDLLAGGDSRRRSRRSLDHHHVLI